MPVGRVLLNPPMRRVKRVYDSPFRDHGGVHKGNDLNHLTPSEVWYELGLIDRKARPTQRGEIFSFSQEVRGWPLQLRSRMKNIRWKN